MLQPQLKKTGYLDKLIKDDGEQFPNKLTYSARENEGHAKESGKRNKNKNRKGNGQGSNASNKNDKTEDKQDQKTTETKTVKPKDPKPADQLCCVCKGNCQAL